MFVLSLLFLPLIMSSPAYAESDQGKKDEVLYTVKLNATFNPPLSKSMDAYAYVRSIPDKEITVGSKSDFVSGDKKTKKLTNTAIAVGIAGANQITQFSVAVPETKGYVRIFIPMEKDKSICKNIPESDDEVDNCFPRKGDYNCTSVDFTSDRKGNKEFEIECKKI